MPTRLSANQARDDAASGLRCAALQPASLTGVDPSRRPPAALTRPVVALALPTYRIVANLDLSHHRKPPPIASLQTQHANSSTHAAKPNANAHTPLPARARANVSSVSASPSGRCTGLGKSQPRLGLGLLVRCLASARDPRAWGRWSRGLCVRDRAAALGRWQKNGGGLARGALCCAMRSVE
jgi:hypothetical protein